MDFSVCKQCGTEIDGKGIQFRGNSFCGDECCEAFEANLIEADEPAFEELDEEGLDDLDGEADDEGLGYEIDPTEEKKRNPLDDDDDFEIDPNDF